MLNVTYRKGKGFPAGGIMPTRKATDRSTPARFEPGQCQNCGGDLEEYKVRDTLGGIALITYRRYCANCKREVIDRCGGRDRDPDIDKRTGEIRC